MTKLKHPPPKTSRTLRMGGKNSRGGCLTPTVELNALAMKRGEFTIYSTILNQSPCIDSSVNGFNAGGFHRPNMYGQQGNRFNYDTRRYSGRGHYHGHFDNQVTSLQEILATKLNIKFKLNSRDILDILVMVNRTDGMVLVILVILIQSLYELDPENLLEKVLLFN